MLGTEIRQRKTRGRKIHLQVLSQLFNNLASPTLLIPNGSALVEQDPHHRVGVGASACALQKLPLINA